MPILFQRFCRTVVLPRPSPIFGRFTGTGTGLLSHSKGRRVLPSSPRSVPHLTSAPVGRAPIQIQDSN
ncbi:unnamed protein product [Urochloa humidicola]